MKATLFAMFVALLMVGCGEDAQKETVQEEAKDDPSVPLLIPCEACGKEVSKSGEACANCSHPITATVAAYRKEQQMLVEKELAGELTYKDFKRWFEQKYGKIIAKAIDYDEKPDDYTGWAKEMYYNGQVMGVGQFKDGKKAGVWTEWYENEALGQGFTDDLVTRLYEEEDANGSFSSEELAEQRRKWFEQNWPEGVAKGEALNPQNVIDIYLKIRGHESDPGQKLRETNWKEGKQDGIATEWHENGQKRIERTYKDGKPNGLLTAWHENGQKQAEGNLKEGEPVGIVTEWYSTGQKKREGNYKDGKQHGLWTEWYSTGQKEEGNYKDGKRDGLWIIYNEDGTEKQRGTFKDDKPVED